MAASFKFCACCNTRAPRLARKCKRCFPTTVGAKSLWRAPTQEEIEVRADHIARTEKTIAWLLEERP